MTFDPTNALTELESLAEKLGVEISYDHFTGDGAGSGGLCRIKGKWRAIIERKTSATEKVSVLARCLARFDDIDAHFLSPAVRELVERLREDEAAEVDAAETRPAAKTAAADSEAQAEPDAE